MREYCLVCDGPMRLVSGNPNAPILLWECCQCQPGSLIKGTRMLMPNWGLLYASLLITDPDDYRRCPDDERQPGIV
jgi:hypothetical protein